MRTCAVLLVLAACGSGATSVPDAGGGGDDDEPPDAADLTTPPTFETQFEANDAVWEALPAEGGGIEFGVAEAGAEDGLAATLRLPGDPALGNGDRVGPAFGTEIESMAPFHFGTYRARLRVAACDPGEEVVNGYFTYFNDGTDHDGDGLVDNSEIDIEILCGTPAVIFLSSWTDYDTTGFHKWTRAIDLTDGSIYESPSDHEYGLVAAGNDPALAHPDLLAPDRWVELGFDWAPDRVRFVAMIDGAPVTLWDLTDASLVPQLESRWLFNVWHAPEHWYGDAGPPDYPAADATLHLDWARYWAP